MIRNAIKANWTLEELEWTLRPPGRLSDWDGLLSTFVKMVEADHSLKEQKYFGDMHRIAETVLTEKNR
jgi:hypothetical protein